MLNEASNVERSEANRRLAAGEGGPLEALPEAKREYVFSLQFPSQWGLSTAGSTNLITYLLAVLVCCSH